LTVSFMPFPTAILGARLEDKDNFPVVFYAASMTLSSIVLTLVWLYAVRRRLVDPDLPVAAGRQFTARAFLTSAIFLLSVGAAFFGLPVAVLFWVVLLPAGRMLIVRALARDETASRAAADGID
jgi:uncharacterized membrane protein